MREGVGLRLVGNQDFPGMSCEVWNEPPKQESRGQSSRHLCQDEWKKSAGLIPAKVSDKHRAIVTAGFANEVDAVNQ